MKIIKNYLTKNRCYQQNKKRTPIGIQLHTIGTGQGTAQSVADYWNQSAVSACVTYVRHDGGANGVTASNSYGVRPEFIIGVAPAADEADGDMEVVSPMQEGDYMEEEFE